MNLYLFELVKSKSSPIAETGDRLARIDTGRKVGAAVPPFWRGAKSPSNAMWPGLRPTSISSGILIHPAVGHNRYWPKIGGYAPFG